MKNDVCTLMTAFDGLDDARLRFAVGRTLRYAVNRWTLGERKSKPNHLTLKEMDFLRAGRKIDAVKEVRERLDLSLLDAKHYVEKYMGPYYIAPASYSSNLQS